MTPSPTRARLGGLGALLILLAGGMTSPGLAARPAARERAQSADPVLVAQTATVARGGAFTLRLGLDGVPPEGSVQLVLHDRVRSRSELAASMEGEGLRRVLHNVTTPISTLPPAPDGNRRLTLSLDPAAPTGIRLSASGAYPLEVVARDAEGAPVGELVTHVIAEPADDDESPPLAVAVLAELGAPPALQPDGTTVVTEDHVTQVVALAQVLAEAPGVPATISVVPETLDALAGTTDTVASEALRAAALDRSVLLRPYVDTSLQVLASAGLGEQRDALLARGRSVLADALGVEPDESTWIASPDLGAAGLRSLQSLEVQHVVVREEHVDPVGSGRLGLSTARPFLLAPPGDRAEASDLDAIAVDPLVEQRVGSQEPDPVRAHHLLAELAVLWLEQPGVPRGTVVPIDASVPAEVVRVLLAGLEASRMLQPTTLSGLFDEVAPLLDAAGSPVERVLAPEPAADFSRREAAAVAQGWARLETFRSIVGPENPRTGAALDHLLLATATDLDRRERIAHLDAAVTEMDRVTGTISATDQTTITLTARSGTVPLTIRNDAGTPVDVVIHLRSPKLEFPDGESIPVTLSERTTRLDLAVRARTSGAFPLDVEIMSPDGRTTLASTRYTVQSTAVSGVGLVLSLGALAFLVVWWGRHWHKTRRSAKLVGAHHPSARSHAASAR